MLKRPYLALLLLLKVSISASAYLTRCNYKWQDGLSTCAAPFSWVLLVLPDQILYLQRRRARSKHNPLPLYHLKSTLNRLIDKRISSGHTVKRYIAAMPRASPKELRIIASRFMHNSLLHYPSYCYKPPLGPCASLK
jgi:hypothetical protein